MKTSDKLKTFIFTVIYVEGVSFLWLLCDITFIWLFSHIFLTPCVGVMPLCTPPQGLFTPSGSESKRDQRTKKNFTFASLSLGVNGPLCVLFDALWCKYFLLPRKRIIVRQFTKKRTMPKNRLGHSSVAYCTLLKYNYVILQKPY